MADHAATRGVWRTSAWRVAGWGMAGLLLLVPLAAMQFTDEVAWSPFDFAFMAALLGAAGLAIELAVRRTGDRVYSAAVAVAVAAAFLLVWINGAVGIIGSEQDDANLLFGGVPAVAIVGAVAARFRPLGMARASFAAAVVQLLVPVVAPAAGMGDARSILRPEVLLLTGFFAALWLVSAWLFRTAAQRSGVR